MITGPIISTLMGAGLKLVSNLVLGFIESRQQKEAASREFDSNKLKAIQSLQGTAFSLSKYIRPFVTVAFVGTYCYLMIYYAHNSEIEYSVMVPKEPGIFAWIWGSKEQVQQTLTGGLMLASFVDLVFMVAGFYYMPSKRR